MRRVTTVLLILVGILLAGSRFGWASQQEKSKHTIVPGARVGGYTLGISKDDVLRQLGEPDVIQLGEDEVVRRGQEKYNLDNLPDKCILTFGNISFWIDNDSLKAISVRSPLYKFSNGLGVGDSEQKIKQAFGEDFQLEELLGKNYRWYYAKGLAFEIHKKNQTVAEILVFQPEGDRSDRDVSEQQSGQVIVPGVGMGDFTLDMNKDDILNRLGKPRNIHFGGVDYTLDNLPQRYFMFYDGISFLFDEEAVTGISTNSPRYQFANGLKVGDPQDRIIQALGEDFQLKELKRMDVLIYEEKGLRFEIDKRTKTVEEISVNQVERHQNDTDALDSGEKIKLSVQQPGPIMFPKIDRRPKPEKWRRGTMKSLPKYDPDSTEPFQVDLRNYDLSKLDLRDSIEDLMYADFDHGTVWPTADRMPEGFDRERIMELGKNPGLGVRKVHERGITGRGIGIAIIDQPLLTEHQEYADRLRLYEEINIKPGSDPAMHGAAVASIALGKTVGVAPEADLYYIGSWTGDWGKGKGGFEWNFAYYAQAVRRILQINRQLPDDRKIRVISISVGWSSKQKGYDEMTEAVEEAKKAGMLIVCSCIDDVHGLVFDGLSRAPLSDPDDFASCEPGLWLAKGFYRGRRKWNQLWVPMGSRTTAAPNGVDEYVFYRMGGWSWAIPYVAGVYALAAQADPEITPDRFWKLAMKTGRTVEVEHQGRKYELGPIVDPVALISSLQKK